jgi:hypothetical protein
MHDYIKETHSIITEYVDRAPPILNNNQIIDRACIKDKAVIGDMIFKFKKGNWHLYFLSFQYPTYKELNVKEYKDFY